MSEDKGRIPTSPAVQRASDFGIMKVRYVADELEVACLEAISLIREAGDDLMSRSQTMMRADYGELEARLYRLAAAGGEAKAIHKLASEIVRKNGMQLPDQPDYSDYDILPEKVCIKMRTTMRR